MAKCPSGLPSKQVVTHTSLPDRTLFVASDEENKQRAVVSCSVYRENARKPPSVARPNVKNPAGWSSLRQGHTACKLKRENDIAPVSGKPGLTGSALLSEQRARKLFEETPQIHQFLPGRIAPIDDPVLLVHAETCQLLLLVLELQHALFEAP